MISPEALAAAVAEGLRPLIEKSKSLERDMRAASETIAALRERVAVLEFRQKAEPPT
jgi:hypothetical protein